VRTAVYQGRLSKPSTCEVCGAEGPVQGHHDDYSKPHDVRWLCGTCHGFTHRNDTLVVRERTR
jgi:ribosomal protein S27AE